MAEFCKLGRGSQRLNSLPDMARVRGENTNERADCQIDQWRRRRPAQRLCQRVILGKAAAREGSELSQSLFETICRRQGLECGLNIPSHKIGQRCPTALQLLPTPAKLGRFRPNFDRTLQTIANISPHPAHICHIWSTSAILCPTRPNLVDFGTMGPSWLETVFRQT